MKKYEEERNLPVAANLSAEALQAISQISCEAAIQLLMVAI